MTRWTQPRPQKISVLRNFTRPQTGGKLQNHFQTSNLHQLIKKFDLQFKFGILFKYFRKGKLQYARTSYLIAHITYVQCSFSTARRYHRLITMNSGGLLPGQCVMAKFSTSNIYLYLIVCSDFRRGHVKILKRLSLSAEFWINFLWLACLR